MSSMANIDASITAFANKIVDDAEKKVRADVKTINAKAKDDFVNRATEVILLYYSNYTPKVYDRIYNLRDNVLNTSENAWIQFNSRYMADYADGGNKDAVVQNFMQGIHGKPSIQVDSPSPAELMENFQNNYKKRILDNYFRNLGYKVK